MNDSTIAAIYFHSSYSCVSVHVHVSWSSLSVSPLFSYTTHPTRIYKSFIQNSESFFVCMCSICQILADSPSRWHLSRSLYSLNLYRTLCKTTPMVSNTQQYLPVCKFHQFLIENSSTYHQQHVQCQFALLGLLPVGPDCELISAFWTFMRQLTTHIPWEFVGFVVYGSSLFPHLHKHWVRGGGRDGASARENTLKLRLTTNSCRLLTNLLCKMTAELSERASEREGEGERKKESERASDRETWGVGVETPKKIVPVKKDQNQNPMSVWQRRLSQHYWYKIPLLHILSTNSWARGKGNSLVQINQKMGSKVKKWRMDSQDIYPRPPRLATQSETARENTQREGARAWACEREREKEREGENESEWGCERTSERERAREQADIILIWRLNLPGVETGISRSLVRMTTVTPWILSSSLMKAFTA